MKIVETILKLLSVAISVFERAFPAVMAWLYSKTKLENKFVKANNEALKKNADIAAGPDNDNPVDQL